MKKIFWICIFALAMFVGYISNQAEAETKVNKVETFVEVPEVVTYDEPSTNVVENDEEEFYGRCMATTKKGTQCKRNAKNGSHYCWQHGG